MAIFIGPTNRAERKLDKKHNNHFVTKCSIMYILNRNTKCSTGHSWVHLRSRRGNRCYYLLTGRRTYSTPFRPKVSGMTLKSVSCWKILKIISIKINCQDKMNLTCHFTKNKCISFKRERTCLTVNKSWPPLQWYVSFCTGSSEAELVHKCKRNNLYLFAHVIME